MYLSEYIKIPVLKYISIVSVFFVKIMLDCICKKVKQSRNRPGVAQKVPGGLGSQILSFGT
jgi:hypothetical protein